MASKPRNRPRKVPAREIRSDDLYYRRDGSVFWGEITGAVLRDSSGEPAGLVTVTRDVTERKRTEELLQNAQKLEPIGILAGGIAHDFNNLLTGIFGHLEFALEQCKAGSFGSLSEVLADALSSFSRARDLTRQLLTFTKSGTPATRAG
jgi:two-component system cell cycle sensor histidine kinase/response regulator CckA